MDDIDQALHGTFQFAFERTPEQDDFAWRDFMEEQLPEKLAWSAFAVAMSEVNARLQQILFYSHQAAGRNR